MDDQETNGDEINIMAKLWVTEIYAQFNSLDLQSITLRSLLLSITDYILLRISVKENSHRRNPALCYGPLDIFLESK